jgi:peptide/nickel transport system permease protein
MSEASLSFLGFADPESASWGTILSAGRSYLQVAWWISFFPGLLLFITTLGFNFLGEGLSEVFGTVE